MSTATTTTTTPAEIKSQHRPRHWGGSSVLTCAFPCRLPHGHNGNHMRQDGTRYP